jgi:hypothetical protein
VAEVKTPKSDIGLMPVDDKSGNDNTQNKVGLGITSEKSNQNGDGDHAGDGSKRNKPTPPHNPYKDETFNEHRDRRNRKINAQSGGNTFPTSESQKNGKDVADDRTEARTRNPNI